MSYSRNNLGIRSTSVGRQQQSRSYANNSDLDSTAKNDVLPNILPDVRTQHKFIIITNYFLF